MTRYVLTQAVACGGRARGFDQGAKNVTCAVYVSDWIIARFRQEDYFSQGRVTERPKGLSAAPQYFAGKQNSAVAGFYTMGEAADFDGTLKVVVTVCDYEPSQAYKENSERRRVNWGTMLATVRPHAMLYINEQIGLKAGGEEASLDPRNPDELGKFCTRLREPGFTFWRVFNSINHAIGTWCSEGHLWLFDPLVGETVVPLEWIESWFSSALGQQYLKKFSSWTAMRLSA
jgi:hypothetical protein